MPLTQVNWKPAKKDLRQFAIAIFVGFTLIAWALWFYQGHWRVWRETGEFQWRTLAFWWGIPLAVSAASLLHEKLAKPFYFVWMGLAFVMGTILSYFVLFLLFYAVVTPVGLVMRLFGHDPMRVRAKNLTSNWVQRKKPFSKASCERLS